MSDTTLQQTSDNELKPGFYWVRLHEQFHDEVACWNGKDWICLGIKERWSDKIFRQVAKILNHQKIEPPKP